MRLTDLAKVVEGKILNIEEDLEVKSFTIDSRSSTQDSVFIPLKGNTDGHSYIEDALKKGL